MSKTWAISVQTWFISQVKFWSLPVTITMSLSNIWLCMLMVVYIYLSPRGISNAVCFVVVKSHFALLMDFSGFETKFTRCKHKYLEQKPVETRLN